MTVGKAVRHAMILEIIHNNRVETQEDLARHLEERGMPVTQATISRDIKELGLVKVPTGNGHYRYARPEQPSERDALRRVRRAFEESVMEVAFFGDLVVIRTLPGIAPGVASAIDGLHWPEIVGSVAGDDTIFLLVRDPQARPDPNSPAGQLAGKLLALRG